MTLKFRPILPVALLLVISSFGLSQQTPIPYCVGISRGVDHAEALQHFCQWVVSFDTKLPNIIGDEQTRRFRTTKGKDRQLVDTTSARIAYIDDRPHITDVAINHVPVPQNSDLPEALRMPGAWSYGDYGSDLRLLFGEHTFTRFAFAGLDSSGGRQMLVFRYQVPKDENHRWEMQAREKVGTPLQQTFPGYAGRILLDPRTFDLVRFERYTTTIEKHFPLRFGGNQVQYKRLPLGDGTTFVLPTESVVTFCHDDKHHRCEVNDTTFENWQKFGAKSRILTGAQPE